MSTPYEEKSTPAHIEHRDERGQPRLDAFAHDDIVHQDVTADQLAKEAVLVDEQRKAALRQELLTNRQGGWVPLTPDEKRMNRALNRRFDIFIIPILALVYMFNQLDRNNLGNAQTAGFSDDLGIPASSVNLASTLFFVTYVPFQPIAVGTIRYIGQVKCMGVICVLWGILTISNAFIKTQAQLIALRMLIGLAETGFYPTAIAYMSSFYPRYEVAFRFALFYGCFSISGAFGGLIAFGVFQIHGSLWSWQYLFIIEGIVPIILGCIIPFWLAREPKTAWYLTPEQREFADKRMVIDAAANLGGTNKITRRDIKEAVLEWRLWCTLIPNICFSLAPQGFTIFFPVVVKGLGYTGAIANLMTVPPYVCGAIAAWIGAYSSDRLRERTFHLLTGITVVIIGLILAITIPLNNVGGRYAGLLVLIMGAFEPIPVITGWLAGNTPEPGKRTLLIAINGWGNLAGIIGSQLFLPQYGPDYQYPLKVTAGLIAFSWVGLFSLSIVLRLVNRSRARRLQGMTKEEIEEEGRNDTRVGDRKYTFVYGL